MNELNEFLSVFKKEYPILIPIRLQLVDHITDSNGIYHDLCGAANCDIIGEYIYDHKIRYKHILPKEILIHIDSKLTFDQYKIILFHEIAHCLCYHVERKIKNDWVVFDHPYIFYDKYVEVMNFAIKKKIIQLNYQKIDHKILKHLDEMS